MPDIQDRLIANGDFLHLSRTQPEFFDSPISFSLSNDTSVTIIAAGIIQFEPIDYASRDVIYSCGVHGNETAPIEICDDLVSQILCGQLLLKQRLLVLFANLPSMDIAQRFVQENMNRLFDGEHNNPDIQTNQERQRAKLLEQSVTSFFEIGENSRHRCHYDLHTAIRDSKNEKFAVYPFTHGNPHKPEQLVFLRECGVSTILLSESPTTTFSYSSSKNFGADAFTVELGKVRPFGQNDMTRFEQARKMLTRLVTETEILLPEFRDEDFLIYRVNQVIDKHKDDFCLHFDDDTPNFTDYEKATVLASEDGQQYIAEFDGEAIVFPNANVAIGQRALLTVIPSTISKNREV